MESNILHKELSIVIPTLNEESAINELLASLSSQREVEFEIIVADGFSSDRTIEIVRNTLPDAIIVTAKMGRAFQLNAGANQARGEYILFLHADSLFSDYLALKKSLDFLKKSSMIHGKPQAGHFSIRFRHGAGGSSLAYRMIEAKASLNRKGCSHGDQGILVPAGLMRQSGGFDEKCQFLAETRFADKLLENGQWQLLPAELSTSARRFEKEGLFERQALNAVIMTLGAAGLDDCLNTLTLYPVNGQSLNPGIAETCKRVSLMISSFGKREQEEIWRKVGIYICENGWHLPFWGDVILSDIARCRNSILLKLYDHYPRRIAESRVPARLAAIAARLILAFVTIGRKST